MTIVKSTPHALDTNFRVNAWIGSLHVFDQSYQGFKYSWTDSHIGDRCETWKYAISHGINATTAADAWRVHLYPGIGRVEQEVEKTDGPGKWRELTIVTGAILGTNMPNGDFINLLSSDYDAEQADIQARLSFFNKYRNARTAFQGGTMLGELRETLKMLKSPALALRQGIDTYVRVARKRASRTNKIRHMNEIVRQTYLEYTYGWRPLISDINQIAETLRGNTNSYRQVIEGHGRKQAEASDGIVLACPGTALDVRFNFQKKGEVTVRYKGAVSADFEDPPSLMEFSGLGLSNFIPTVWELIPYSFLVDYFSNIGKVIDAASLGIVHLGWGCRTERRFGEYLLGACRVNTHSGGPNQREIYASGSVSGFVSNKTHFVRSSVSSVRAGILDFQLKVPGVDNPWKWLNIAALANQKTIRGV